MKRTFLKLAIIVFMSFTINAKDLIKLPTNEQGLVVYTEIIEAPQKKKNDLFTRAMEWLTKAYMSEKEVVKMQDREAGKIIGQGKFPVYVNRLGKRGAGFFHFTISIYTKDEKYKIELSSFFHEGEGSGTVGNGGPIENEKPACGASILSKEGTTMSKKEWLKIKKQVNENAVSLINDLKKFMSEENKDNW